MTSMFSWQKKDKLSSFFGYTFRHLCVFPIDSRDSIQGNPNLFPIIDSRDYRVPEELWMEVCDTVQEAVTKTIPKKKKCNKAKWLSEEALQIPTHELL